MDQIAQLFVGILVAAGIFAATLFSAAQTLRQGGRLRLAHGAAALLTIAGMACLSAGLWLVSQIVGAGLIFAAFIALILDRGWNRLLPVFHMAFGAALLAGIPTGG